MVLENWSISTTRTRLQQIHQLGSMPAHAENRRADYGHAASCNTSVKFLGVIFNRLFDILCLLGLIWQVYEVSVLYFKYDVVTRVSNDVPQNLQVPSFHACFRYADIVNFEQINQFLGTNWTFDPVAKDHILRMQRELTVRQIFDSTPSEANVLTSCAIREPKSYKISHVNDPQKCRKYFRVTKYIALEYVCYKYDFLWDGKFKSSDFELESLAYTVRGPGNIFRISPGGAFDHFIVSKFLVTNFNKYPHVSIGLAPLLERHNLKDFGYYLINYFSLNKQHLPAPYKTDCFDYTSIGEGTQIECQQKCLKDQTLIAFNKIPFSIIQTEKIDNNILSYDDVIQQNISGKLFKFFDMCNKKCRQIECIERHLFDRISIQSAIVANSAQNVTKFGNLGIYVYTPTEPSVNVTFIPNMESAEYATYLFSCFGTWFGLSVIVLNPVKQSRVVINSFNKTFNRKANLINSDRHCGSKSMELVQKELNQLKRSLIIQLSAIKVDIADLKR